MSKLPRATVAQAIAHRLTTSSDDSTELAREIAAYLISENREADLESVMRDVMRLQRRDGVLEADVQTARELEDTSVAEVTELVRREFPVVKRAVITQTVRPELVGGVRITTADEQLDMSVRGKLDTFKRLTHEGTI